MKILKSAGTFEILHFNKENITDAARTCYQSLEASSPLNDIKLLLMLLKRGHHAMIEFGDMTVRFDNVSRGNSHELVRHRLCSFAQESTRYVDESDFKVVVPPHQDENQVFEINLPVSFANSPEERDWKYSFTLAEWLQMNENMYRAMIQSGWKPEDARQILPIATKAEIVTKANLREWRHIFNMRTNLKAHWEIRNIMIDLLLEVKKLAPIIFSDFIYEEKDGKRFFKKGEFTDAT